MFLCGSKKRFRKISWGDCPDLICYLHHFAVYFLFFGSGDKDMVIPESPIRGCNGGVFDK
jgi:hypothetical protein